MMNVAFYSAAVVAAVNAWARHRKARFVEPAQRYLAAALWCLALCLAADAPATAHLAESLVGHSLLVPWLSNVGAAGFGLGVVGMCLHLRRPYSATARPAIVLATLVAVVPTSAALCAVLTDFGAAPLLIALQPLGTCGLALVQYGRLMAEYHAKARANATEMLGIRLGLLSVACGGLWVAATVWAAFGGQLPVHSQQLRLLAGAFLAGGFSLSLVNTVRLRWRATRLYRQLTPLWNLFDGLDDLVQLQLPDVDHRDPHELLYRRVIEIRDAQRLLRGYLPPDQQDRLHSRTLSTTYGLRPHHAEIVAEASRLTIALDNYRTGRTQHPEAPPPQERSFSSIYDEARWLSRVAHALREDPFVVAISAKEKHPATPVD